MGLLSGVRIFSVEQYGAGPFGTQALADLGAEVIKIENPNDGGDVSRSIGPCFDNRMPATASSLFYQSFNRNKRSVALDLGTEEGRSVFRDLVVQADAVACNLRGDVPSRLGLTYDALADVKRDIVCCHLSAYGRDSSRAARPGYDYLVQAETGYFSINGEPGSMPSRFGLSIIDFMTGYCLALSIVAGLFDARRCGVGRDIEVSLYDVGLANLNYMAAWALNGDYLPEPTARSAHPSLVPCQLFPTADGWVYIMANKEKFFTRLCKQLGKPELAVDQRFNTFAARLQNREALTEILDAILRREPTTRWIERLSGFVPVAPITSMVEALRAPFTAERGMIVSVEANDGAKLHLVGSPIRTGEVAPTKAAPVLGHDTEQVLAGIGYRPERIKELRARGVLG